MRLALHLYHHTSCISLYKLHKSADPSPSEAMLPDREAVPLTSLASPRSRLLATRDSI